jgi:hypothetical protein
MEIQGVPDIISLNDDLHLSSESWKLIWPIKNLISGEPRNNMSRSIIVTVGDDRVFNELYHKILKDVRKIRRI